MQIHTAEDYDLKHGFTILGNKGVITLNSNPWLPTTENSFEVEVYETSTDKIEVSALGDAFYYQVSEMRKVVLSKSLTLRNPMASPLDSLNIMQLLVDWENACKV